MIASNAAAPYTWCCPTGGTGATVVCLKTTTNQNRVVVVKVVTAFWMAAVARQTWFNAAAHCALGLYFLRWEAKCMSSMFNDFVYAQCVWCLYGGVGGVCGVCMWCVSVVARFVWMWLWRRCTSDCAFGSCVL